MTLVVTTQQLRMRQLRPADFEAYAAIYSDPETVRFIGGRMDAASTEVVLQLGCWTASGIEFGHPLRQALRI